MKIIPIFITLFAVSLAAPTEVTIAEEKDVAPEISEVSEKLVEKVETVSPSNDSLNVQSDKVVDEVEAVPTVEVASPEDKEPVIVIATSVESEKADDEQLTDEEKNNQERETGEICRASTGATEEEIALVGKEIEENPSKAVKCYIKCMSEAYGIVQGDRIIRKDIALKKKPSYLTTKEFETAIDACIDLKTDDPCDSAYLRYSCYFRMFGDKIRNHSNN